MGLHGTQPYSRRQTSLSQPRQKGTKTKAESQPLVWSPTANNGAKESLGEKKGLASYLPGLKVMSDDKNEGAAGWDFLGTESQRVFRSLIYLFFRVITDSGQGA